MANAREQFANGLEIIRRQPEDFKNWNAGMSQSEELFVAAQAALKTVEGIEGQKAALEQEIAKLLRDAKQVESNTAQARTENVAVKAELAKERAELDAVKAASAAAQKQLDAVEARLAQIRDSVTVGAAH
jgi:septal ring factor EnvC (AmiA/AmiB activator)